MMNLRGGKGIGFQMRLRKSTIGHPRAKRQSKMLRESIVNRRELGGGKYTMARKTVSEGVDDCLPHMHTDLTM